VRAGVQNRVHFQELRSYRGSGANRQGFWARPSLPKARFRASKRLVPTRFLDANRNAIPGSSPGASFAKRYEKPSL
jgi:hypothetical protein